MKLLCPPKVKRIAVLLKVDLLYECEECCCILVSPSEPHNCCQIWINRRRGRSQTLGISNESSSRSWLARGLPRVATRTLSVPTRSALEKDAVVTTT